MDDKTSLMDEIAQIRDERKLLEIYRDNDDISIRYAIVNLIDDDSILYEIFSNEEDSIIKNIALMKISADLLDYDDFNTLDDYKKIEYIEAHNDESLLYKFVENGKNFYVSIAAIYKIQDMDFIRKMANSHEDYDTRVVLYKKLKNKPLFEEITGENLTESRVSLVENLDNVKFIKDIALNDSKSDVRIAAVERIDDKNVLAEIARNDVDSNVRLEAIKRIDDKNVLAEIARNDVDSDVRLEAIKRIDDKNVLAKTARNDSDNDVRRAAVEKIDDENLLVDIARNDEDFQVRMAAIYGIQDMDVLFEMANSQEDYDTRVFLYKKLNSQSLTEEMTGENLTKSRIRLVKNLDSEKFIKDIAINDSDLKVKSLALKKLNKPNFYLNLLNSSNNDLIQSIDDIKDESQLMDVARFLSSDYFIVKHAINNIANPSVLFELYRRGPYIVRKTAMEKLVFGNVFSHEKITDIIEIEDIILSVCDKGLLAEIARDGFLWDVRSAAVERIDDEEVLVDIARTDSMAHVRSAAVRRIDDEEVLVDIARNDPDNRVRRAAVKQIDDEEVLVDIARNDPDKNVRETAVGRIDDEEVLVDIARNDPDSNVRRTAILMIDDENVLVDIARNEEWLYICREAFGRINDEDFLADIARNDPDDKVRRAAVENIYDEDVLADIARNDSYSYVRRDAVRKITDNDILAEIARNDSENHVRKAAVERIDDEDILAEIARNDTNNDDLEYIARNHSNPDVRYEAVEKITNKDVLVDIARNEYYGFIRKAAVKKINDEDILADIARNDRDYNVRYEAVEKITNEEVLADIARNNSDGDIQEIALGKIRDCDTLQKLLLENFGYLPGRSYTSFKRNYHSMIYEQMGTGLYDYILDRIADESAFIGLLQERLFGDLRVMIAERLVSPDALRDLALNDSDYRVRLEAIRNPNLCDEETFAEIVQSDHNEDVRFEALNRIDNKDILEDITTDLNPVMRIYALERPGKDMDFDKRHVAFDDIDLSSVTGIEDENVLYCIANDAPSAQLRRYAFDKIRDEHILADLACHNREFTNLALNKITDNALLLNIALYCADESVRRNAVKKIDDEELLLRAVQRNPCNDISAYIIDHIRDESILEIIALNNSNPFNRKTAVNRIKSQDILIRLGEVECEEMVCTAIVRKCHDKGLLEYIGLSNPCKTVRRHVGSVTDDDELLYRFALKEYEYDNRRELISRLTNEEYILNLLKRETVADVFESRFRRPDFKITDTCLLIDLAKNAVSGEAQKYAMNHIKDQSVLTDFIRCSPFISNGPENESVWEDFQYHREGIGAYLSLMSNPNFNDMKVIEEFLIENEIALCQQLYDLSEKVWEIPSIYRIVLNCKSENVRKMFKPKLKYSANNHGRRGNDEDEENSYGLGALFDSDSGRRDDDEDEKREAERLGALFG